MPKVGVVVRIRPCNSVEEEFPNIIRFSLSNSQTVSIGNHQFNFDQVYLPEADQESIFYTRFNENVDSALDGFDSAIIAYGQTAAGKSYTMFGGNTKGTEGIIPRAIRRILECQQDPGPYAENSYSPGIEISFVEIHKEKVYDLFDQRAPLVLLNDGTPKGAKVVKGTTVVDSLRAVASGVKLRSTATTKMNDASSRSHGVLTITLGNSAKLMLVDLAGSETVKKTGASGSLLQEAGSINRSLTSLAMIISSLTTKSNSDDNGDSGSRDKGREDPRYIPYRSCKLTHILKRALDGQSITTLIINCSPSTSHAVESLNSLRFGARAKLVRTGAPKVVPRSELEFWRSWNTKLAEGYRNWQLFGPPTPSNLLDLSPIIEACAKDRGEHVCREELKDFKELCLIEAYPVIFPKSEKHLHLEEDIDRHSQTLLRLRQEMTQVSHELTELRERLTNFESPTMGNLFGEQQDIQYYRAIKEYGDELNLREVELEDEKSRLETDLHKFLSVPTSPADYAKHFGVELESLLHVLSTAQNGVTEPRTIDSDLILRNINENR